MNKHQQNILFWLVCFFIISILCVVLGWSGMTGLVSPTQRVLEQMKIRGAVISFVLIISALILIQYFYKGTLINRTKTWGVPILIAATILILLFLPNENNLRLLSCCGENSSTIWGFPYGWVECEGRNFCGVSDGNIYWSFATINFWISINLMVCIIGIAENIFNASKKIVVVSKA